MCRNIVSPFMQHKGYEHYLDRMEISLCVFKCPSGKSQPHVNKYFDSIVVVIPL